MTEAQPVAPPTEQIYGIAKKMNLELDKLPLHTHAIIINMLRGMVEHRKVELDNEVQAANIKAQEAAMADARKAHAEAQIKRDEQLASEMIRANAAKPPRLSIVLDQPKADPQYHECGCEFGKCQGHNGTPNKPAQELVATL